MAFQVAHFMCYKLYFPRLHPLGLPTSFTKAHQHSLLLACFLIFTLFASLFLFFIGLASRYPSIC